MSPAAGKPATVTQLRNSGTRPRHDHYDVVVVGARAAGASTAMLLARSGASVLAVDRSAYGSDTLSTHALMRGGVEQLHRWGLLDRVAAVSPAIRATTFEYANNPVHIPIKPARGVDALYAPRRTHLDPILVDAARESGVETLFDTRVMAVTRDPSGRVNGVDIDTPSTRTTVSADVVVGADGLHSFVARQVGAAVTRRGEQCSATIMSYVEGADLPRDQYIFSYGPGVAAGSIPTSDDQHCVFVAMLPARFSQDARHDIERAFTHTMAQASTRVSEGIADATRVGPLRSFPGHVGQFRQAQGPGWALVGDAGYFKDPAGAHGMTDALRDAELLSDAINDGDLARYERLRNELSGPFFDQLERLVASFERGPHEVQRVHIDLAAAMTGELEQINQMRQSAYRLAG